ncbi:hypothetical protein TRIATDRAFT_159572 [Trichoderma atroviride IMI 206040]|uniref:Uncharacterized protein n=1 Tax=Hypocrea atroviridis (strain ATCC 20476 / IMI 206040) TaxID=452589 RepID=G9NSI2_HYPAI|nr:uncharacterized protein TRIATDRAFT_159572 [Trichoderma atroviride IMI 206040]EHK46381.1 hypothetical protein TRIATDRAFT_159572 [Trichoderma atroviride IMI 206040]
MTCSRELLTLFFRVILWVLALALTRRMTHDEKTLEDPLFGPLQLSKFGNRSLLFCT